MSSVRSAAKFDFYTATHKGQRRRLFAFAQRVGTSDFSDPDEVDAVGEELQRISRMLRTHARHESEFIHPFLAERFPAAADFLESEHDDLENNLVELQAFYEDIQSNPCAQWQCLTFGGEFYRALQRFIARYLDHMDEEEATMVRLWHKCEPEELRTVVTRMLASMSAEQEREELWDMLPALNPFERVKLFRTLRYGLDDGRYDDALALAERALEPRDWDHLQTLLADGATRTD